MIGVMLAAATVLLLSGCAAAWMLRALARRAAGATPLVFSSLDDNGSPIAIWLGDHAPAEGQGGGQP